MSGSGLGVLYRSKVAHTLGVWCNAPNLFLTSCLRCCNKSIYSALNGQEVERKAGTKDIKCLAEIEFKRKNYFICLKKFFFIVFS